MLKVESPLFTDCPVDHGFFTRLGGVSPEPYDSLNCSISTGDTLKNVQHNLAHIATSVGYKPDQLYLIHQVHSAEVVVVTPGLETKDLDADALVTNHPGVLLGIKTADCVPILLVDPGARVIGAVHAGWGGALKGIVEATVNAMVDLGAVSREIRAAIGPCIHSEQYEVGEEFRDQFLKADPASDPFFLRTHETLFFDLPGFMYHKLQAAGVHLIEPSRHNTYAEKTLFYSHRRATHEKTTTGRQLSVIGLKT